MNRAEAGKLGYEKSAPAILASIAARKARTMAAFIAADKHCPTCSCKLAYEQRNYRFCSTSCAATKYNFPRRAKRNPCAKCGKLLTSKGAKHCRSCAPIVRMEKAARGTHEVARDGTRRAMLLRSRSRVCEICGLNEWMGKPIQIEMDHVDGDHANNADSNLRLICPNCHAQTPTYKGNNYGRGRTKRRVDRQAFYVGAPGTPVLLAHS